METLKKYGGWIVSIIVGAFGILVYLLKSKQGDLNAEKAKNSLATADKTAALLDSDIKHLEEKKSGVAKAIDEATTSGVQLASEKKKALKKEQARKPDEVEDYWNK